MRLKRTFLALALVFTTSFAYAGNQPANLSGFDFNYSVDLNKSIGLTQVFDDGDRTYFQFTQAENMPTIYAMKDGKKQQVSLEVRPPYLIAAGVASKYVLSANNGKSSIYVSYNGNRADEVISQKMAEQPKVEHLKTVDQKTISAKADAEVVDIQAKKHPKHVKAATTLKTQEVAETADNNDGNSQGLVTGTLLNIPFFENSISLSKKAKADLSQRIDEIVAANKIVVRGRPSVKGDTNVAGTRALTIKNYLVDLGVDEALIETTQETNVKQGKNQGFYVSEVILLSGETKNSTAPKVAPKKQSWELSTADNNLETALNKWAAKAGYQPIVWDLQEEIPINSSAKFEGSFEDALEAVIQSLRNSDLPLKAKYYGNKVVRISTLTGAK